MASDAHVPQPGRPTVEDIENSSTLDAEERAELKNPGYEIFIALLSILSIVNLLLMAFISDQSLDYVLLVMNGLLSLILFLDFCFRLKTAESRSTYFLRQFGWADLLASLPVAQVKILRVFRLIRVWRLLREYGVRNIWRSLVAERAGSALLTLLLLAILVLEFGSLAMIRIESRSPDANITSASDALWYVIVTISTVGYGDQYPVTNQGRLLGSFIIVLGVGIFGTLTGYLANVFLSPKQPEPDDQPPTASDVPTPPDDSPMGTRLAQLARAGELRSAGVLTDEEFATTKAAILGS
jgi:voltage-gated potassium channel